MQAKKTDVLPSKKKKKNAATCHSMSHSAVAPLATAMEAGWRLNHLFESDKVQKLIAATWVKLY